MRSSDRPASLARRALPAVLLAGVSGAALTQLDRPSSGIALGRVKPKTSTTSNGTPSNTGTVSPSTVGNGDPTATSRVPNSSVPAPPACSGAAVLGPVVETRWGPVQVKAVLTANGKAACSADAPVTPSDRNRSLDINSQAVPLINDEVKVQGVNFDSITGATVTSDGYRESLQAVLDGKRG